MADDKKDDDKKEPKKCEHGKTSSHIYNEPSRQRPAFCPGP